MLCAPALIFFFIFQDTPPPASQTPVQPKGCTSTTGTEPCPQPTAQSAQDSPYGIPHGDPQDHPSADQREVQDPASQTPRGRGRLFWRSPWYAGSTFRGVQQHNQRAQSAPPGRIPGRETKDAGPKDEEAHFVPKDAGETKGGPGAGPSGQNDAVSFAICKICTMCFF